MQPSFNKGDISSQIATFIQRLKRRELSGGYTVGLSTANLMLRFVSATKWSTQKQILNDVRALGKRLEYAQPQEIVCGNIVRRVLAIIRESYETAPESAAQAEAHGLAATTSSMFELLSVKNTQPVQDSKRSKDYKADIIEGIQELIDEIQNIEETISPLSFDMVHENEVILTPTPESNTVLKFLLRARQKRNFTVIVTESYPNHTASAHKFVRELNRAGIETVLVPDTMAFALMSRVGKVVVGARAVLANGGCVTSAGVGAVCECAKTYRTPVLALTGLYKLSPLYPYDIDSLIEIGDSGRVVQFEDGEMVDELEAVNPICDYVTPENVDIVVTNL